MMVFYFLFYFIIISFLIIWGIKNIITHKNNPQYCAYMKLSDFRRYYNTSMQFWNTTFDFDNHWGVLMNPIVITWFIIQLYKDRPSASWRKS